MWASKEQCNRAVLEYSEVALKVCWLVDREILAVEKSQLIRTEQEVRGFCEVI